MQPRRFRAANSGKKDGILVCMKLRSHISTFFPAIFLSTALLLTPAASWAGPSQDNSAKQDMQNAGHSAKNATKDAASGTKKETKKGYNATKKGTKKAANKTKNTTKGAVNGGKEGAKQPQ